MDPDGVADPAEPAARGADPAGGVSPLAGSVVRVRSEAGGIAGAGFLVTDRHVLTCAHVVAAALGVRDDTPEPPAGQVRLDFPLAAAGEDQTAAVVAWFPVRPPGAPSAAEPEDVAVLELAEPPLAAAQPAALAAAADLWGHAFRAYGFPAGYDDGVWASGVLRAALANGWVQVEDSKQTGYFVAPGFSGGPVWDEQERAVVGMVVGADRRVEVRAAFALSVPALLRAWPALDRLARPPSPYRGLYAFREEDGPRFFGREAVADRLLAAIGAGHLVEDGTTWRVETVRPRPLVAVVGPSGSGKSSVVFAGLVHRLRTDGRWLVASFTPGERPFDRVAAALIPWLEPTMSETDRLIEVPKLAAALRDGGTTLGAVLDRVRATLPAGARLLLVADQFEELYTLCRDAAERTAFLDVLLAAFAAAPTPPGNTPPVVVLTLRADFVSHALSYRPLADALQDADLKLGPMTREELQDGIERPAELLGVRLEPGLTDRLLDDVGGAPGRLPLLEFALTLLWERQEHRRLTHAAYDAIGGVEKALAGHAEEVYGSLAEGEGEDRLRRVFVQLVRPGEGTTDTRRRATRAELGEATWALVARLASERLVVTGRDEATGEETVEVAHEALIGGWGRLTGWMGEDRPFRAWQERLRASQRQWAANQNDEGALLRGAALAEAEGWCERRGEDLGEAEGGYIAASVGLRDRERAEREAQRRRELELVEAARQEAERRARAEELARVAAEQRIADQDRSRRRLGRWVKAAAGFAVMALAAAAIAWILFGRAREQADIAETEAAVRSTAESDAVAAQVIAEEQAAIALSRQLAAQSRALVDDQLDLALLLSLEALNAADTVEARSGLLTGLLAQPQLTTFLTGHSADVASVAFSPDGATLAVGSSFGTVILWDVAGRRPLGDPLAGHTGGVTSVAFSPDGQILAIGGCDLHENGACTTATVTLWDVASRQPRGALAGTVWVRSVAFSPDGATLAASGGDDTVTLWDVASRQLRGTLAGHTDDVFGVAFSPDGTVLASGSEDQSVILWDVADLAHPRQLGDPLTDFREVYSVAFSPDGKTLAAGGRSGTVGLWDVASRRPLGDPLAGLAGEVYSVAFSPDGKTLAAGSDNTVILWGVADLAHPRQLGDPLTGYAGDVSSVAFSPDGATLAVGSDGTAILADVASRQPLVIPLAGHNSGVYSVVFSPDGTVLASGSLDGTVVLWDVADPASPWQFGDPGDPFTVAEVSSVAFSPDGNTLATGNGDGAVMLWNVDTRRQIGVLGIHAYGVTSVAFSPDGTTLASGGGCVEEGDALCQNGDRGEIVLWDVTTGRQMGTTLSVGNGYVRSVAFSPDGATLATGTGSSDDTVILWDVASRQPRGTLAGHTDGVDGVAFSPDGATLASGSHDGTVILWDVASLTPRGAPLTGHRDVVSSVAFSPDGATLASGSHDGTVILWDVASRQPLGTLADTNQVNSVAFSPDGTTLADDGGYPGIPVTMWDVDLASWESGACARANRNLSAEEWQRYFGDVPYRRTCPDRPAGAALFAAG